MKSDRFSGFALAALVICLSVAAPVAADVQWVSGGVATTPAMDDTQLHEKLTQLAQRPDQRRVVIHLDGPVGATVRQKLESSGVKLLGYLGGHAYFATLAQGVDIPRIVTEGRIAAVEAVETQRKMHPDLAAGIVRPWSIIGGEQSIEGKARDTNPFVAIYVMFHPDVNLRREGRDAIARHGATVRSWLDSINGAVIHLPAKHVPALAAEDDVMYVEPPLPMFSELNDGNRPRVGADVLQELPYGLDGSGVTVLVYDGGAMFPHADFGDRLTLGDSDGTSDHATHVGGTVGGDGTLSGGDLRGMAPGVELVSYGFEVEGGLQQGFLYTDPGDIEDDYTDAINTHGADLSNNSIGSNTAPNGFPCEWEGNYGATGALIDSIAAGALGDPFRIVWANGNERQGSGNCGSSYLTTAPPACAKGHITVGALNSNDDSVTSFTSWGPCDDGRMKPDISSTGCQSNGDGGVTSTDSSGGYNVKCGTSMASPTVAGISALLLQNYRQVFPGEPDFRNSTLKAILAQTAEDIDSDGPDYKSGYGSVRAVAATDLITDGRFIESELEQDEIVSFGIDVDVPSSEAKVTIAWDDPPGTPDVNPVLVNDLDLRVVGPDQTVHLAWTLDPGNPSFPAARNQPNTLDNIEQVRIDNPVVGQYRVEVVGTNIAQGPTQSFSIAAAPSLLPCASIGSIHVGSSVVACEDSFDLQVLDCDLDLDSEMLDTTEVTVVSGTDPTGETVVLTETGPGTSLFENSLTVSAIDAPGVLHVTHGDAITATYVDVFDGQGGSDVPRTKVLTVDCVPPNLADVSIIEVQPRRVTIGVTLDEVSEVSARYGESCDALDQSAPGGLSGDTHEVSIRNLTDETTYFFAIDMVDVAGNASSDDNGGLCYSFTTLVVPEFYTEQFTDGVDLEGSTLTFIPDGSDDFYSACIEFGVTEFPIDPFIGTNLNLGDDDAVSFDLEDGKEVLLYNVPYSTVFVGPNGFLTFGEGSNAHTESSEEHFALPRISALWDDLDPGSQGGERWVQLDDRVAVTWVAVPEFETTNQNSFQVEMFFDGRIRITWIDIDLEDAVVGISPGFGQDPDFEDADLSGSGDCIAHPPTASNLVFETQVDTPVAIALSALDDGVPAPTLLTYRIERLPEYGSLVDDLAGVPITAVPYDLTGGGNTVTYTPDPGINGADNFDFIADDGGVSPTGGPSNTANVAVNIALVAHVTDEFLTDDTDPGWLAQGGWNYGIPEGGGSHDSDPGSGATGTRILGYNLSGDYPNDLGVEALTSRPIAVASGENTKLEFQRWLGVDSSASDHAAVQVSANGFIWTTVWDHLGPAISESAWSTQTIDISDIADGQLSVFVRWTMGPTDGSGTYPGWNIDDVRILQTDLSVCIEAPAEVPHLQFIDHDTLNWAPTAYAGGGEPGYDVLRSDDAGFGAVTCIEIGDATDTEAADDATPAPGQVYHYLIRPENECGVGTLGQNSSGAERLAPSCN